jgi:hypothetical protein
VRDPEAFGLFYERHFASVLAFFRRRVPGGTVERICADPESACAFPACPREPFLSVR